MKRAGEWLKNNAAQLRRKCLAPLSRYAKEIWAALRQESNVDLGAITLEGQGTRRHVDLRAEVDGEQAGALGVMSQGELHALALALFLPRATIAESPFRFVVLDDPIQAMDPSKIDGFVCVLRRLAEHRQVVVLSHDDRLPEAVRRMAVPAHILEVCRGVGSTVQIETVLGPAGRYLGDAFALVNDPAVPSEVRARVLPGICRMAVEAAARDAFMARRFSAGIARADVEATWQKVTTTRRWVALALRDDPDADINNWLEGSGGVGRRLTSAASASTPASMGTCSMPFGGSNALSRTSARVVCDGPSSDRLGNRSARLRWRRARRCDLDAAQVGQQDCCDAHPPGA